MNFTKQLALATEALYACGFRGRAEKLRQAVADELAVTEAAFDGCENVRLDLYAQLREAQAKLDRVRALHYPADNDISRTPICETCHGKAGVHECGCWAPTDRQPVCGHCNEGWRGAAIPWPCPTIRAIYGEVDA